MTLRPVITYPGVHGRGHDSNFSTPGPAKSDALAPTRARIQSHLEKFRHSDWQGWLPILESILNETHPTIFFKELSQLAQELIDQQGQELAAPLLQEVIKYSQDEGLRSGAQSQLDLLMGRGDLGQRLARQIQSLPKHILDGPTLTGMMVGGVAYRLGRGALLKLLIPDGSSAPVAYSLGARSLASLGGLCLETPLFVGITHALRPEDPFEARQAMAHTALTLGSLRSFGFIFQGLGQLTLASRPTATSLQKLFGNAGMVTGLAGAETFARHFNLTAPGEPLPLGLQTLITFAQFKGAGILYHRLAPKRLLQWEQQQDLKFQIRPQESINEAYIREWSWMQGLHFENPRLATESAFHSMLSVPYSNKIKEQGGSSHSAGKTARRPAPLTDDQVRAYVDNLEYHSKFHALSYIKAIQEILQTPDHGFVRTIAGSYIWDWKQWETGLFRLYHLVKTSEPKGPQGGYVNWITRLALEPITRNQDSMKLENILRALHDGTSLLEYEKILAQTLMTPKPASWNKAAQYYFTRLLSETLQNPEVDHSVYEPFTAPLTLREIHRLPIDLGAKARIFRLLSEPEKLPFPAESLPPALRFVLTQPSLRPKVEDILKGIDHSPLGPYRLKRLLQIARSGGDLMASRTRELADKNFQLLPSPYPKEIPEAKALEGTQWDAYLGPEFDGALLKQIYQELPKLLDPERSAKRWGYTKKWMEHFASNLKERNTLTPLRLSLILERMPGDLSEKTKQLFQKNGPEQMAPITVAEAKKTLSDGGDYFLQLVASFLGDSPTGKKPQLLTHEILGRAFHKAYKQSYEVPLDHIAFALFEIGRREKVNVIAQTFLRFEDPISVEVAEAIFSERISFRLEDDKHYDRLIKNLPGGKPSDHATNAMFFAPGRLDPKPLMLVRMNPQVSQHNPSPEAVLFEIFGNIVHEFRHFKEFDAKRSDELGMMFLWETNAHLWEYHWRAKHGNIHYLKDFSEMGPAGFALTFRNMFEQWYPTWIRENRDLKGHGQ